MKRTAPLRAVVFDFDGTLVDSLPLVFAAIVHALEPFGRQPPRDIFARLGGPPERFLGNLLDDPAHVPEALQRMDSFHRQNARMIQPFPGAVDLLQRIAARGRQAAIWTGRDRASTEWLLREHRLEGLVAAVVCGDDLPTHKPDPAGLLEVLRRLRVPPAEALMVGDADVDVLGGAGAKVDTVLIRHGRPVAPAILARARACVATPAEAFQLLERCIHETEHLSSASAVQPPAKA